MKSFSQKNKSGNSSRIGIIFGIFMLLVFIGPGLLPILILGLIFFVIPKIKRELEKDGYQFKDLLGKNGSIIIEIFLKKLGEKYNLKMDTFEIKGEKIEEDIEDNNYKKDNTEEKTFLKNEVIVETIDKDIKSESLLKFIRSKILPFFIIAFILFFLDNNRFSIPTNRNSIVEGDIFKSINMSNIGNDFFSKSGPIIRIALAIIIIFIIYKLYRDYSKSLKK